MILCIFSEFFLFRIDICYAVYSLVQLIGRELLKVHKYNILKCAGLHKSDLVYYKSEKHDEPRK